jgi:hypothetical protein
MPDKKDSPDDGCYIHCPRHGPRRRAYVVCRHLLEEWSDPIAMALAIGFHEPWRKRLPGEEETGGMGQLCCKKPAEEHTLDELTLACVDSLVEAGLLCRVC